MSYLIFSKRHTNGVAMWWRPNASGYTNDVNEAGRYSKIEVESYCAGTQGDNIPVDELLVYRDLKVRRIVDMGDSSNYALLMTPNSPLLGND
ncbi:MAG: hypothetical protein K8L99_32835 [Anaerolineae bacterium]|jgi:hypothetical protein|nr:hypothetical protein [Anaerolineae bacterium]MCL4722769.1 hypothetical protein [Rhodocyclaceae bacterium]MCZ2112843.1 hypothetical protein [Anaerolineae bacterium]GIK44750.1 MAG: hypothetical protein BroJett012_06530 [Betaproteobacteria bacterium]